MKTHSGNRAGVVAQPLYAQVRERLLERIVSREWQHGQLLPNEFDLARQFGVSIGTIRKAVEGLEADKIVVRKQGRGTFVARDGAVPAADPISCFGEAGIAGDNGETATISIEQRLATPQESAAMLLHANKKVIAIRRRRAFAGGKRILDRIALPQHLFFDLEPAEPLPGNLYEFYGDYFGIRAVKCREQFMVAAADREIAEVLGIAEGAPAIQIERTSYSASAEPIEWRQSICLLPKGLTFSGVC